MRVLRVLGGLDPRAGGPTTASVNSIIATARQGCITHVLVPDDPRCPGSDSRTLARLAAESVEVEVLPFGRPRASYTRSIAFSPRVAARLRELLPRYDVIHVDGAWLHTTLAAVRTAEALGRPVVLTPHESLTEFDVRRGRNPLLRRLKPVIRRYYLRTIDIVVFSSVLELQDSVPTTGSPRWRVVPHAVFDETRHVQQPREFELDPNAPFRIGFLGRLHPKKNVELLIDSLADLPANVSLEVAGDGEAGYVEWLRQRTQDLGVVGRVTWLGFIRGDTKADFLRKVDLLTMPSTYECFGMAVIEAVVAGTPVLVTPKTGVAETVQKCEAGVVALPHRSTIARAVTDLLNNRQRLRHLSKSTIRAAATFSFRTHSRSMIELYTSLARPRVRPGRVSSQ